jgi:hypothetical protein
MHYLRSVTFRLSSYEPLTISADMEKGVYPPFVAGPRALGGDKFLITGWYSTGGGMATDVALLLGVRDERLAVLDKIEYERGRGEKRLRIIQSGESIALGLPRPPEEAHSPDDWAVRTTRCSLGIAQLRELPYGPHQDSAAEVALVRVAAEGFRLPGR